METAEESAQHLLGALLDGLCSDAADPPPPIHDYLQVRSGRDRRWEYDPVRRLTGFDSDLIGLVDDLDEELNEFYGGADLRNVGFWTRDTQIPRSACRQLIEELICLARSSSPGAEFQPSTVLAVGAGAMSIARIVREQWPGAQCTAVLGDLELDNPNLHPGIVPLAATPGRLPAADGSCDLLIWVENPLSLDQEAACREAGRVLRPGGRLAASVLAGIPLDREYELLQHADGPSLAEEYAARLEQRGLGAVRVLDVSARSWIPFFRYSREFFSSKLMFQQIDQEQHDRILGTLPGGGLAVVAYLLVTAAKPQEP